MGEEGAGRPPTQRVRILREGYRLVVRAEGRDSFTLLRIGVVVGAQTSMRP